MTVAPQHFTTLNKQKKILTLIFIFWHVSGSHSKPVAIACFSCTRLFARRSQYPRSLFCFYFSQSTLFPYAWLKLEVIGTCRAWVPFLIERTILYVDTYRTVGSRIWICDSSIFCAHLSLCLFKICYWPLQEKLRNKKKILTDNSPPSFMKTKYR